MGFQEFLGNERVVTALRNMLREKRVPSALLFTGPRGLGKFTLARMFAQAANCERLPDDFCGECGNCVRITALADVEKLVVQGLAERGESADTAQVERAPLLLETHPDVWAIVPDPVRLRTPVARPLIRAGQLRAVQRAASYMPQARRRVFILDGADTIRRSEADILLKSLEEAPPTSTLILLATRPDYLQATIRSRCISFHFAPVPAADVESMLAARREMKAGERRSIAQLSEGSPGVALTFDLEESRRLRSEALSLLRQAVQGKSFSGLFAATAAMTKNDEVPFEKRLEVFYSLLTDLLAIAVAPNGGALRNPDMREDLERLGRMVDGGWISRATGNLDRLESRLRRNIGKQLGLDAWAVNLAHKSSRIAER
jgi:DNA polymerase-3 subunit delta'